MEKCKALTGSAVNELKAELPGIHFVADSKLKWIWRSWISNLPFYNVK